jgi:hypothetical protein
MKSSVPTAVTLGEAYSNPTYKLGTIYVGDGSGFYLCIYAVNKF